MFVLKLQLAKALIYCFALTNYNKSGVFKTSYLILKPDNEFGRWQHLLNPMCYCEYQI